MNLRSLEDFGSRIDNQTVLLRLDLNVPMSGGNVTDETRIVAALPTIKWLLQKNCKIIACSHLGRPKGIGFQPEFSMAPVGERIAKHLESEVLLCQDYLDDSFARIVRELQRQCEMPIRGHPAVTSLAKSSFSERSTLSSSGWKSVTPPIRPRGMIDTRSSLSVLGNSQEQRAWPAS